MMTENPDKTIGVLLVDDHAIFRAGLARVIREEPGMDIVGEADDGPMAIEMAQKQKPDVILMDIEMPGMSGIDATEKIVGTVADANIIMLTIYDQDEFLFRALQVGASGYLLKGVDVDDLLRAIRTVAGGDIFIYPRMATKLVRDYLLQPRAESVGEEYGQLSPREKELLPLLAEGLSNTKLAEVLHISPHTVQTHCQRIMQKLNLHRRSELLKYALKKGLIRLEE